MAFIPIVHASRADRPDESDTVHAAEAIAASLARLGHRTDIVAIDLDLSALERLATRRPVVVFNLVEAMRGDAALAHLAPAVLEHLGVAFTGAGAAACMTTLSKLLTKQTLAALGLSTAPWWTGEVKIPADETVIVKSVWEHASFGMDTGSIVSGDAAADEIARRQARFGGTFFAERYVPGREFNLALLEEDGRPRLLPIQEIVFDALPPGRPHIVDYEAKWEETSEAYRHTPRRFGVEAREPALAERLKRMALECWRAFGLAGYARVDVRTDASGEPFILEVNVNPCLTPDAGFVATAAQVGLSYDETVARILKAAAPFSEEIPSCSVS